MITMLLENQFFSDTTIYGKFINFLYNIAKGLDESVMLFVTLGVFVLITLAITIAKSVTYEKKLMKSIKGINAYLRKNPYINEENLVNLNSKMKSAPKALRHSWQEYMLNRDKLPSEYMNTETVIDHPTKASGYKTSIRICRNLFVAAALIIGVLMFSRVFANYSDVDLNEIATHTIILRSVFDVTFLPAVLLLLGHLVIALFESSYASFTNDLFYEYREFQGYVNKACTTMPPYIDYEILFTPKEIKDGISVLQEYLDKKAIQEQKAKEEEALNNQEFEKYDFDALGVEGSILLERAMQESEKYFNIKRNLVERRTSKEQEIANYSKNFDDVTKDFERKAQTIRESMNQITEQLNATSVKIEANYLKKRYDEEQRKLQQLEKDHQLSEARFKKQQAELQEELDAIDEEINNRKSKLEKIMLSEGKAYSNKIYGLINDIVNKQNEPHFKEMEAQKAVMSDEIENMRQKIASFEVEINAKNNQLKNLEKELGLKLAQIESIDSVKEYFGSEEFRRRVSLANTKQEYKEYAEAEELRLKLLRAEEQLATANEKVSLLERQGKSIARDNENLKAKAEDIQANVAVAKSEVATTPAAEPKDKAKANSENNAIRPSTPAAQPKQEENVANAIKPEAALENIDFDKIANDIANANNQEEQQKLAGKMQTNIDKLEDLNKKLKGQMKTLNEQKKSLQSSLDKLNQLKNK